MFRPSEFDLTRLHHSHGDDDWHDMVEVRPAYDSAAADPERSWAGGRLFRCSTCSSEIRIMADSDQPPSEQP